MTMKHLLLCSISLIAGAAAALTNYPAPGAGVTVIVDPVTGVILSPTNLAYLSSANWAEYSATHDVDLAEHGLTLGGVTMYDWPAHGTGDVASWSGFAPTQAVDFTTHGLTLDGTTYTNWPTAADIGALTNEPEFRASPAAGITTENIADWSAAHDWGDHSQAGYIDLTEGDSRYAARNHKHSGIYAPVGHTHPEYIDTNSTLFIRDPDGDSTNKMLFSYGPGQRVWLDPYTLGNVTNWVNIPRNVSTYLFEKVNVGPSNLFVTAPHSLNVKGIQESRAHFSIIGAAASDTQTRPAGNMPLIQQLPSTNVSWHNGDYSNPVWGTSWHANAVDGDPATAALCDLSSGRSSRTLRISHFGFEIPFNAQIIGVEVDVSVGVWECNQPPKNWDGEAHFQLDNNGYTSGIYTAFAPGEISVGGNDSIWGLSSLTAWDVCQNDFALDICFTSARSISGACGPALAEVSVTIYYTCDELAFTHGVTPAGAWTLRDERAMQNLITAANGVITIPSLSLGTNDPITTWPAGYDQTAISVRVDNVETTITGLASSIADLEMSLTNLSSFQAFSAVVAPDENGVCTITYAHGGLVWIAAEQNITLTFSAATYPTNGVNRVGVELFAGTNAIAFDAATINTNTLDVSISTNGWTSLFFRRSTSNLWECRQ